MVTRFLLDSNQISKLIQGHGDMLRHVARVGISNLATSTTVVGELFYMAYASALFCKNMEEINGWLKDLTVFSVDIKTANIYAEVKNACYMQFGPKEKKRRVQITPAHVGLHDNDLWVLAAALRHNCTLVTADRHFERIRQVREFPMETWWRPEPK